MVWLRAQNLSALDIPRSNPCKALSLPPRHPAQCKSFNTSLAPYSATQVCMEAFTCAVARRDQQIHEARALQVASPSRIRRCSWTASIRGSGTQLSKWKHSWITLFTTRASVARLLRATVSLYQYSLVDVGRVVEKGPLALSRAGKRREGSEREGKDRDG